MKTTSLWCENVLPMEEHRTELPERVDVTVIGGGFSGISAALELARSGSQVALIDKEWPGYGACSRNLGLVVERIEGTTEGEMEADIGGVPRHELITEGQRAHDFVSDLIDHEQIECGVRRRGKLVLAHTSSAYEKMARHLDRYERFFGVSNAYMVPYQDLAQEVGEQAKLLYCGAKVLPDLIDINPGKLVAGLLKALSLTDATICGGTECLAMERRSGGHYEIKTSRGSLVTEQVVVATQGYSQKSSGILRNQIFPFLAHVVATEPIEAELLSQMLPTLRGVVDTKQMFSNFRPCDNESRLLLASHYLRTDSETSQAARIMRYYRKMFPELEGINAEYCWKGNLALTGDGLPHIGTDNGIHYCATGNISMALYLGSKIAKRILHADDMETVLDRIPIAKFPFYYGKPNLLYFLLRMVFKALDLAKIPAIK